MTTPRIEEMVENVIEQIPRYCLTNKIGFDALKEDRQGAFGDISELDLVLEKALTQLRQEVLDEAVEKVESLRLGKFDVHPLIQGFTNVGNYNQALDDTIKALQDNK